MDPMDSMRTSSGRVPQNFDAEDATNLEDVRLTCQHWVLRRANHSKKQMEKQFAVKGMPAAHVSPLILCRQLPG